ncbi:MAG: amidohydrolase family protein [Clostridia bacterium]|nr:amidohydrolase family protein [Clostridia bacterium]
MNLGKILWNVTIVDRKNNAPREKMAVLIVNDRIQDVLSMNEVKSHNGYEVMDMEGQFLLPGLIDAHVHLAGCKGFEFNAVSINPMVRAYKGLAQAQNMLRYGFTTVRDISFNGLYLKRVINHGDLVGPRIIACGPGINRSGGHADVHEYPYSFIKDNHFWGVYGDGKEEVRKAVRMLLREGADQIKFFADGGGNNAVDRIGDMHYTYEEMKTIVEEAKMIRGTKVCAHAEIRESINACVDAGVDSIEHGEDLTEEIAEKMKKRGTFLVPTLNLIANWSRDFVVDESDIQPSEEYGPFFYRDHDQPDIDSEAERKKAYDNFKLALRNGVEIALGSDSIEDDSTVYGYYSAKELEVMVDAGMTALEGIKAATSSAARLLGVDHLTGSIEKGKLADLIVVSGDITKDVKIIQDKKNIQYVFQSGKLVLSEGNLHI